MPPRRRESKRRDRERKPARQTPYLDPKPRILVVCEGEVTEPQYLRGFTNACKNPRVTIKIAPEHGTPKTLVEIAKTYLQEAIDAAAREKDDNLLYDSVWCVFDVDEHPHIPTAISLARDKQIQVAISNPSFELWLLLHFRDSPGFKEREAVRKMLKKFIKEYDKRIDYAKDYEAGYAEAVKRAKGLDQIAKNLGKAHHEHNPCTGVYQLTESIRTDERPTSSSSD